MTTLDSSGLADEFSRGEKGRRGAVETNSKDAPQSASLNAAEEGLVDYIRQHAEFVQKTYCVPKGWRYRSQFHLLLALGRRFTPVPNPSDLTGMPAGFCYSNAALYARAHRENEGVVYAEGFALTPAGIDVYLPHAWIVNPDGTVLDPTWEDAPGRAYVGIPIADPALWPVEGGGLLHDFNRTLPLLRGGLSQHALAALGRPLTTRR